MTGNKLMICTWKNANKSALVQAFLSALFCILYTYIVKFLIGGEEFVGKQPSQEVVNGIKHDVALVVCGIFAGLIPIILLKYKKLKYLCLYLPMSIIYYFFIMLLCVLFVIDDNFDLIFYALEPIPIGSLVGTVIAMVINYCNNTK